MIKVHTTTASLAAAMERLNIRSAAAIEVDNTIFLSGLTAIDTETGELIPGGIREHARHTLELYRTILTDIGLSLDHVVKVNCYLADPHDFTAWNEEYLQIFEAPYPCRTTVTARRSSGCSRWNWWRLRRPRR
ncbi:MAG: Rid family hydrolase [Acidimicrobiales bacterium]